MYSAGRERVHWEQNGLKKKLTQTLIFLKFPYAIKRKCRENCTQNTIFMPKAITQSRADYWTKNEAKTEKQTFRYIVL